ncbi:MAG: DUF721 domain-containing protein [Bacteroidales bacterium]
MNEHNIKDLINTFLEKNGKQTLFNESLILDIWPKIMGDFIVQNTQCIDIKNGTLIIKVLNASLRFELASMRSVLIKKLNDEVGNNIVKEIILK